MNLERGKFKEFGASLIIRAVILKISTYIFQ